jgi:hypothetical protein
VRRVPPAESGPAVYLEMGGCTEFDSLDEIMSEISIDAGLPEGIERRTSRSTADEPSLQPCLRWI